MIKTKQQARQFIYNNFVIEYSNHSHLYTNKEQCLIAEEMQAMRKRGKLERFEPKG